MSDNEGVVLVALEVVGAVLDDRLPDVLVVVKMTDYFRVEVFHTAESDDYVCDAVSNVEVVEHIQKDGSILDEVIRHSIRLLNQPENDNLAEIPSQRTVQIRWLLGLMCRLVLDNLNRTGYRIESHELIPVLTIAGLF